MPLKGAYTVDELAQRCAKAEIEIERLRAANKKLFEMLCEAPCDTNGTIVAKCLEEGCCCAIADYAPTVLEQTTAEKE